MIDTSDIKDFLEDRLDDLKEKAEESAEKTKDDLVVFKGEVISHFLYALYKLLSAPFKAITVIRYIKIYYYQLKHYKDDSEKIYRICEYVKHSVRIQSEGLYYPLAVLTGRVTDSQMSYIMHILLSQCRINTKLVTGTYNNSQSNIGTHTWLTCTVSGDSRYVDVIEYSGIVPVEEEKRYKTDKRQTVELNLRFNKHLLTR